MALENKVDMTIHRETIQNVNGQPLTDKEWVVLASEIEGRVDNYLDELIPTLIEDLEELVNNDEELDDDWADSDDLEFDEDWDEDDEDKDE
jgi:hypothetical protein